MTVNVALDHRPAAGTWTDGRLALAVLGVAATLGMVLTVVQTAWGTLLSDVGLSGAEAVATAVVFGFVEALFVCGFFALLFWGTGRAVRAPRGNGLKVVVLAAGAITAGGLVDLVSCLAELLATGSAPIVTATNPARWGDSVLGGVSLANVAFYTVAGVGSVRYLRWHVGQAAVLVVLLAAIATGASALG
jgi:hypothetical protein